MKFYDRLATSVIKSPKADIILILDDFNANIGSNNGAESRMGKHGLGHTRNDNGERLVELSANHNFFIGETSFPHFDIHHKYTWQSPDGRNRNQIDHVLISKKYHN